MISGLFLFIASTCIVRRHWTSYLQNLIAICSSASTLRAKSIPCLTCARQYKVLYVLIYIYIYIYLYMSTSYNTPCPASPSRNNVVSTPAGLGWRRRWPVGCSRAPHLAGGSAPRAQSAWPTLGWAPQSAPAGSRHRAAARFSAAPRILPLPAGWLGSVPAAGTPVSARQQCCGSERRGTSALLRTAVAAALGQANSAKLAIIFLLKGSKPLRHHGGTVSLFI